jgi:branched-chain amino acid transport system ATP-binding protein
MTGESVLRTEGVTKRYGLFTAVSDNSIDVRAGEIVAVVGPNGAGKSTLFGMVGGQLKPDTGKIWFNGADVTKVSAARRAHLGLVRTFQVARLFTSFTVEESVALCTTRSVGQKQRADSEAKTLESVGQALAEVSLTDVRAAQVSALTQGERKRLEMGMAVAQRASMIVLDEPTAGLTQSDARGVVQLLQQLRASNPGLALLLSSHDMEVVSSLADRIVVMHSGSVLIEGDFTSVMNDERVIELYLGRRREQ